MATPVVGYSADDFVSDALLSIGVLDPNENPTTSESVRGRQTLNVMLDSWDADGLTIFTTRIDDFPLISSQQLYTQGPLGDFDMDRPAYQDRCGIIILSNPAQPLEYPIPIYTTQDWADKVPIKNVPGNLPLLVYDDGAFPLRNLTFWPVAASNTKVRFYSPQHLQKFTDQVTKFAFPPGYAEAITYNLAIRLAPKFGVATPAEVALLASNTLATVKSMNADDVQLRSDIKNTNTPSKMRSELFNIP